jgi:hypothetical protein
MVRADCTLNIDSINQRRRSQGLTLGVSTVNDFLAKTEGNSLDTIPLSEPEDSTIYNSLGEGQMDSLDSRVADRRNAPGQLTTSSFATPSREFLPKSPQDMILDLINPENIQLLNTRQSSLEELKKEYTKVSPWDGAEDSSAVDGEVRENSDDPVVSQAINDMLSSGKFSEIADADRNSTVTRAELMKTLFNPQTARLAKNGNLEQVGINSSSTTGTEYEQIFDDIKDNLVRNGIITRQEVTQIERIFNPPPPPPPVATTTTPPVMVTDPVTGVTTIDPVNGGTTTGTTTASTGTGSSGSTSGSSVASATPAEVPWSIANPEAVANGTVIPVGYDGSGNSVPVPVTHNSDGTASWGSPTSSSSAPIDHSGEPGYRPGQ